MNTVKKALRYLTDKQYRTSVDINLGRYSKLDDIDFLKLKFQNVFGYPLDLDHPVTYNEKLQWLKLYDRNPIYPVMVDKYRAKAYIDGVTGEKVSVPLLGVWDSVDAIDISALPNRFVLKTTHDCGGIVICKDKATFDFAKAKRKLSNAFKKDYYNYLREWPYTQVTPRIIAEPYLEDQKTGELRDYKFFCFDGRVELMFVASDRQTPNEETKFDFFDMDYRHLDLVNGHPNAGSIPEKPSSFEKMKELASTLSKGFPHVRVDFYEVDGKPYVGELTLYHWSGFKPFQPSSWDQKLGSCLVLPGEAKV